MKRRQRRLHFLPVCNKTLSNFRRGISLHGHAQLSREGLGFLKRHIDTVPIVARIAHHALARYRRDHGEELDFNRAFWTAPLSPRDALELERSGLRVNLVMKSALHLAGSNIAVTFSAAAP